MSSPTRRILPRLEAAASLGQLAALTDDLLEEIFVRIASPIDLARAATACASFHRLITDPAFLRRYRSLHPPLILGFVNGNLEGFQPAEVPHPSAPAGRAMARAADFSFDFLPQGRWNHWNYCNARDGRILLDCYPEEEEAGFLPDLVVCDPLSRRYLLLPPIPDGQVHEQDLQYCDASLVPCADEDNEASFRVIVEMQCATDLVVFVHSSGSGSWSLSISQDTLSGQIGFSIIGCPCYAYGCIYWQVCSRNKLLKLNMERMEFSTVDLPLGQDEQNCIIVVVEEGDGRIGFFSHIMCEMSVYYYTSMQNEGNRANEWQIKNVIQLPTDGHGLQIIGTPQRYIFLIGDTTCFALEIKTMKIERVSHITIHNFLPFLGFPPSMSPRRI
ncbi:unnamed protein product [Urochloa decumbens]|uniref:F-box protein AT5G49610-like beta-propeller domain-containing protein n=1 Tax=Urochloa decumbens TaxID=240449 RepID=A0ABC9G3C5_9POAL